MYITTEVDKEFEKSVKNRQNRWRRMKNMKITEVEKGEEGEVKKKMLEKLVKCYVPDQFHMGKPKLPVIRRSTELTELVGFQSWILFKVSEIPVG